MLPAIPYWSLSSFYFWYYAALGAFTPFFARWLHELGLGGVAIGTVMAMWYLSRIVSPSAWSLLCARAEEPVRWLHVGAVLTALSFAGFLFAREFWALLAVMLLFGGFANAILPQFEAITLDRLGTHRERYGRIRVWGSLGFVVVAVGFGPLLDWTGNAALPALMLPLLAATVLAALATRGIGHPIETVAVPRLRDVLRRREVRDFLLIVLLVQVGFGPFYVLYTLHLGAHGHGGTVIGLLWGLGVVAEIGVFLLMPQLLRRWSTDTILRACIIATALRWAVVALVPQSLPVMLLMQGVHALSFGAFHAACMQRIGEFFPGRLGQKGQGLMYGFSSGIGGVLGALLAGGLWDLGGGLAAFLGGAVATAAALLLARRPAAAVA